MEWWKILALIIGLLSLCFGHNPHPHDCRVKALNQLTQFLKDTEKTLRQLQYVIHHTSKNTDKPRSCQDLLDMGDKGRGLRKIYPDPDNPDKSLLVFCDQMTDGGGWMVFQKRWNVNPREEFNRPLIEYILGFGCPDCEYWMGLQNIHDITSNELQEMRVDLVDCTGEHKYAKYETFYVGPPEHRYYLHRGRYWGTAGDGLDIHNLQPFTTANEANYNNYRCVKMMKGGWWYGSSGENCANSNLNGKPYHGNTYDVGGITWQPWRGKYYSFNMSTMMMRPASRKCNRMK